MIFRLPTQSNTAVSALVLKRQSGVRYRTARLVKYKLLEATRLVESDRHLTGRAAIDDAYVGGDRSGGKAGRGSEEKAPFVAASADDREVNLLSCGAARRKLKLSRPGNRRWFINSQGEICGEPKRRSRSRTEDRAPG